MNDMNRTMQEAMRLMQQGDLSGATLLIQNGLPISPESRAGMHEAPDVSRRSAHEVPDTTPPNTEQSAAYQRPADHIEGQFTVERDVRERSQESGSAPQPSSTPQERNESGFRDHIFESSAGTINYKLFVPAGLDIANAPLLIMLHGCTQSPDDFARGTRMNALAQEYGYVVAYPAQAKGKNANKCWNWFRSEDQQRGRGEPALIAALTCHLLQTHRLDDQRVYAAGLSAGGAMAAVLASTYPDIFAAIGVHSGLPCGVARDLPSALAAMKPVAGVQRPKGAPSRNEFVPTIVFHGDRDATVDPCNGAAVIAQSMTASPNAGLSAGAEEAPTIERGSEGGRQYTRSRFTNADGHVLAEQWVVHGGGHAWFGGNPSGSHADPTGPAASEHMLRFFAASARGAKK